MLRNALYFMLVGAFIVVVGFGVYIVNDYFNRLVLPEQPVLVYALSREGPGKYEIEFLGETLKVNTEVIQNHANNILTTGENKLLSLKNDPLMNEKVLWLKETVQEQWQVLLATDGVRAVRQWIEERI
ncbi:hypothetical protein [Desulfotomaculum sp. 1211_IL3151]|uniref:hypothetical protein n=1 Tax=Desulfotomaculum sp. 1211_IL3151 TaxID=3084055 RepID=UPI002FD890EB